MLKQELEKKSRCGQRDEPGLGEKGETYTVVNMTTEGLELGGGKTWKMELPHLAKLAHAVCRIHVQLQLT